MCLRIKKRGSMLEDRRICSSCSFEKRTSWEKKKRREKRKKKGRKDEVGCQSREDADLKDTSYWLSAFHIYNGSSNYKNK